MKRIILMILICAANVITHSQELYVFTEPASNMATGSLGFRLNNFLMPAASGHGTGTSFRTEPEIMWGVGKKWMLHGATYASNMFQSRFRVEGGSLYAKYRFYSVDEVHSHFRLAAFGKLSVIGNPVTIANTSLHTFYDNQGIPYQHPVTENVKSDFLNIDGDHSGYQAGLIATKLQHKLAVSGSVSYIHRLNNLAGQNFTSNDTRAAINMSASAGYLLFPKAYTGYRQTNCNLYLEMLGSHTLNGKGYAIDAAPAIQFIFNSIARVDLGYRFRVAGEVSRHYNEMFLVRLEYNWLNAIKRRG